MKFNLTLIALIIYSLTSCNMTTEKDNNGLIIKQSPHDFNTTYNKLRTIINTNPNLKILLELDHSKNAASVDLKLNPTKIILFGNPKLGTPLMQNSQTTSIDLPQKIIVYSDENGTINIAYNNPSYLKNRHAITDNDAILDKVTGTLNKITDAVISSK